MALSHAAGSWSKCSRPMAIGAASAQLACSHAVSTHVGLYKQLAELDNAALERAVRNSPLWCEKARLLRTVPAVDSGQRHGSHLARSSTGTRYSHTRRQIAARWESPHSTAKRQTDMRRALDLGRPRSGPRGALHVHAGGDATQSRAAGLLRSATRSRQETGGRGHGPACANCSSCSTPSSTSNPSGILNLPQFRATCPALSPPLVRAAAR
jgi:hypothetical protein